MEELLDMSVRQADAHDLGDGDPVAQKLPANNVVWLAEQCRLLEHRNLQLRREVRDYAEANTRLTSEVVIQRDRAEDLQLQLRNMNLASATSQRAEERLQVEVQRLQGRIVELEKAAKAVAKDRIMEGKVLDRICEKHASAEAYAKSEAARHAEEEAKYTSLLEDFKALTDREMASLREDVLSSRRKREELQTTVQRVEKQLVETREELTKTYEKLSESREAEQQLTLEREMLHTQLAEMKAAYRRDVSEAQAQAAGMGVLQARLLETQGRLREAEAEAGELRKMMADVLSRESTLLGRLLLARGEAASAVAAKVRADRFSQIQRMTTLDLKLRMDREMETAVAHTTREAVVQAVKELTGPGGVLKSTRNLNSVVTKLTRAHERPAPSQGGRSASAGASKARPLSASARAAVTARARRAASPANLLPLDDDDAADGDGMGKKNPALSRVVARERSAAKQVLGQALLQRSFDVLERKGVDAARTGRRIALQTNDSNVQASHSDVRSTAVGDAMSDAVSFAADASLTPTRNSPSPSAPSARRGRRLSADATNAPPPTGISSVISPSSAQAAVVDGAIAAQDGAVTSRVIADNVNIRVATGEGSDVLPDSRASLASRVHAQHDEEDARVMADEPVRAVDAKIAQLTTSPMRTTTRSTARASPQPSPMRVTKQQTATQQDDGVHMRPRRTSLPVPAAEALARYRSGEAAMPAPLSRQLRRTPSTSNGMVWDVQGGAVARPVWQASKT